MHCPVGTAPRGAHVPKSEQQDQAPQHQQLLPRRSSAVAAVTTSWQRRALTPKAKISLVPPCLLSIEANHGLSSTRSNPGLWLYCQARFRLTHRRLQEDQASERSTSTRRMCGPLRLRCGCVACDGAAKTITTTGATSSTYCSNGGAVPRKTRRDSRVTAGALSGTFPRQPSASWPLITAPAATPSRSPSRRRSPVNG